VRICIVCTLALDADEDSLRKRKRRRRRRLTMIVMNRMAVKVFWQQMKKPTDPAEWRGRDGVIAVMLQRRHSESALVAHAAHVGSQPDQRAHRRGHATVVGPRSAMTVDAAC
jgi:hypothetical protein